jgi:ArsR family transcriptional regulator, arsenate/arsenite/antimonite-responsive transcriptional repressor
MKRPVDPMVRLLRVLGDPVRLAIVQGLAADTEICACDFARFTDVSQPTVSHHLRVLREAGVVRAERRGTWIYYTLEADVAERLRELASRLTPAEARPASLAVAPGRDGRSGACATAACDPVSTARE